MKNSLCIKALFLIFAFGAMSSASFAGPSEDILYDAGRSAQNLRDYSSAATSYRSAAEKGHTQAQLALAVLYNGGFGVAKSASDAERWATKAAHSGDMDAQNYLADQYGEYGRFETSYSRSAYWYGKAAKQGDETSQYELGGYYYSGFGIEKSNTQARFWLKKAAAQGNRAALIVLEKIDRNPNYSERDYTPKWTPDSGVQRVASKPVSPQSQPSRSNNSVLAQALKASDQGSTGYDKCTAVTPSYDIKTLVLLCDNSASMYELMAEITDPPITPMQKDIYYLKAGHAFTFAMKYRFISAAPKQQTCDTRDRSLELFAKSKHSPPKGTAVDQAYTEASSQMFISMCGK